MGPQKYRKDFDSWNIFKQTLEKRGSLLFKRGDIRWCHLGINVGHEQDGGGETFARPVVVYKKINNYTCIIIPLTTRKPRHGEVSIQINGQTAVFLIHQIRLIDSKRLNIKIGEIDIETHARMQKAVHRIL